MILSQNENCSFIVNSHKLKSNTILKWINKIKNNQNSNKIGKFSKSKSKFTELFKSGKLDMSQINIKLHLKVYYKFVLCL